MIDPIYKVITGDENSADQMAHFCNQFDKVCTELHSAVIYCHHHSKGGQGMKRAIDRASGSGVFARDPDAILDMIQLCVDDEKDTEEDSLKPTAWRISGTLREFPTFEAVNVWFAYPIHKMDDTGLLAMAAEEGSLADIQAKGRVLGNQAKTAKKESRISKIDEAYEALSFGGKEIVTLEDMAKYFDVTTRTIRTDIVKNGKLEIENGYVRQKRQ